ncbi:MAG: TatD family hydrolase [bacterium]|nr:TatD family hydrolase [bacterium]
MIIDVHCHLADKEFNQDLDQVIQRAKDAGVVKIIISTVNFDEIQKADRIVQRYKDYVYLTVGCSPILFDEGEIKRIREFIKNNRDKIVGIGEVGLDYYWVEGEQREIQRRLFKEWIVLAKELNLPLIVHSRSAGKYAMEILLDDPPQKVLMHAFDGKCGWAKKGEEAGFYFTIPTTVVHSIQKQNLVKFLKIDSLMLETDSPVLAPVRGERNEPANLKYALETISSLKHLAQEETAKIIAAATTNFFNLEV